MSRTQRQNQIERPTYRSRKAERRALAMHKDRSPFDDEPIETIEREYDRTEQEY
jgi:hypothetical protein